MEQYREIKKGGFIVAYRRLSDGATIPAFGGNRDYRRLLEQQKAGNVEMMEPDREEVFVDSLTLAEIVDALEQDAVIKALLDAKRAAKQGGGSAG